MINVKKNSEPKTVYFINFMGMPDSYFYDITAHRDGLAKPFVYLREQIEKAGYLVKLTNDCSNLTDVAAVISFSNINYTILRNLKKHPKYKCIIGLFEPPVQLPYLYDPVLKEYFGSILTMFDDQIDNETYFKLHNPQSREAITDNIPDFDQKKFCAMIQTNGNKNKQPKELYSERYRLAKYLSETSEFDLFGAGWEDISSWRGPLKIDKLKTLKNYKFSITYENMRDQLGYVTEKIFDPLFSGCVPIYWGASNITKYIPAECFIDRRNFSSNEELHQFLNSVDRSAFNQYIEAAKTFIQSEQYQPYTFSGFAKPFLERLNSIKMQSAHF